MNIMSVSNNYNFYNMPKIKPSYLSFGKKVSDTFVKSSDNEQKFEKLRETLTGDYRKLNKEFFDNLSDEEYKYCLDWANSDEKKFSGMALYSAKSVMDEDVDDVVKYGDFFYSGLQKIAKQEGYDMSKVLLVGIGQSPAVIVKLMELTGLNTANCPISGLATFREPVSKYVTKENVDKYFSQWSKFGFNLDDLFGDKMIIFVDHKETGATLKIFKKIINNIINIKKPEMEKLGKKPAKIRILSMNTVYRSSKKQSPEKEWGADFEDDTFSTSYLKTLYSPLFKIPLPNINEISERAALAKKTDRNLRFNKLTVLLYDALYNDRKIEEKRRHSTVDSERHFRLSFYTPKINHEH